MLNSGRRGKRSADGYGIISVNEKFNQTNYPIPVIDSWAITDGSYVPTDDTALDTAGGQTVVLYGSGFTSGVTVNIVGGQTGPKCHNRINHLVELGTKRRFTNSKTIYRRVREGVVTRSRPVRTASGGYRTIKEKVARVRLRSIESVEKKRGKPRLNRGIMPAFHQLARAVAETSVEQIYETEIRAGLQRIADRAAKSS